MLEGGGRELAEEALRDRDPKNRSCGAESSLVALEGAVDDVEEDLLVGDVASTEGVDEDTKLHGGQDVDGALADEEDQTEHHNGLVYERVLRPATLLVLGVIGISHIRHLPEIREERLESGKVIEPARARDLCPPDRLCSSRNAPVGPRRAIPVPQKRLLFF